MCPDHPCCATPTKVVVWGGVPHVVNHAKFHQNRFRGFGYLRVEICLFLCIWNIGLQLYPGKRTPYDRNAKRQQILTELSTVNSEYVCERTTKFSSKILFDSTVINLQISMTKYLGFQYSVTCHWSGSHVVLTQKNVNHKHGIFRRRSRFN